MDLADLRFRGLGEHVQCTSTANRALACPLEFLPWEKDLEHALDAALDEDDGSDVVRGITDAIDEAVGVLLIPRLENQLEVVISWGLVPQESP